MSALALQCIKDRRNQVRPTIIVTAGSGLRDFIETDHVKELLVNATSIIIASEIEKNEEVQIRNDLNREKLSSKLAEATNANISQWKPTIAKDLADYNLIEINNLQQEATICQGY